MLSGDAPPVTGRRPLPPVVPIAVHSVHSVHSVPCPRSDDAPMVGHATECAAATDGMLFLEWMFASATFEPVTRLSWSNIADHDRRSSRKVLVRLGHESTANGAACVAW